MAEEGEAWQEFVEDVNERVLPQIEQSSLTISIAPPDMKGDVKFWVELGASIMYDKPIFIVAFPGTKVPAKLAKVADDIYVLPEHYGEDDLEVLGNRIKALIEATQDG